METKANYILIGSITLLLSISMMVFGLWAAKYSSDRSWQMYRVIFNEAVTGLSVGSTVQYNGIAVGSIVDLSLARDDPRQVIARLKLHANAPIKTDTRARLAITSLTGPTIIQLSGGTPQSEALTAADTSEAPIIKTEPSALQDITNSVNHIAQRLESVLSDKNIKNIELAISQITALTSTMNNQQSGVATLLKEVQSTTLTLKQTLQHTDQTILLANIQIKQQLPVIIKQMENTLNTMDAAAHNANGILQDNRTAIQSFANDGLSQLGPTLAQLRDLIRDLRQISDGMRNNPARYLLGHDAPKEFSPK